MAIQALTEDTARDDVYKGKIVGPFNDFWFLFKPTYRYRSAANKMEIWPDNQEILPADVKAHGGTITPRSSANKAFDGNEITAYLNDESGKKTEGDIVHEWRDTIRNMLAYGERIHGFALYVSTFGDFEHGGGANFFRLCKASFANERNDLGQTSSGLVVLFIPAYDGYDNCIDVYGHSIIDDPEEPFITLEDYATWKREGTTPEPKDRGAKSVLLATRKHLMKIKDWSTYNGEIRSNPFALREANTRKTTGETWNTADIAEKIAELQTGVPAVRRVDLKWSDGNSLTRRPHSEGIHVVVDESTGDAGRFAISLLPPEGRRSLMEYDRTNDTWKPYAAFSWHFHLGVDPFKFGEHDAVSRIKKLSKGAGVMKYLRDYTIDPIDKAVDMWETDRIVLHYLHRPETTEEFCEDMLKAAVLFGCMATVERNVDVVIQKWREWKFSGYLNHLISPMTGQYEKVPGINTGPATHQEGLGLIQLHLKHSYMRERHYEVMQQVLDCEGPQDVTRNDLVAAWEMCEIGIARSANKTLFATSTKEKRSTPLFQLFD